MTAETAIHNFFQAFGLTVVREGSVYSGGIRAKLPYIILPDFTPNGCGEKAERSLEIWYRDGLDWKSPLEAEALIAAAVPLSGADIPFEGGSLHLTRSKPFSKTLPQSKDNLLKGIKINLTYEYVNPNRKAEFTLGNTTVVFGAGCEIVVQESLCGGRAESICGKLSIDCLGKRREIKVLTDWIPASKVNTLSALAASSPLMTVNYPYDGDSGTVLKTEEFIVDIPIIKQVSRDGGTFGYVKAEIRAAAREVDAI